MHGAFHTPVSCLMDIMKSHPMQSWLSENCVADVDLTVLYRFFNDGTIIMLLTALLANISIIFFARDSVSANALTDVQEALLCLLTPLEWQNA